MLTAIISNSEPYIKGKITQAPMLIGRIVRDIPEIKGSIRKDAPVIKCTISNDIKKEAYYEVSNEYGTTIVIGD